MAVSNLLILAGVGKPGKTNTLKKLVERFDERVSKYLFRHKGKLICVYTSSPQETPPLHPKNLDGIMKIAQTRLDECGNNKGNVMIVAFQLHALEEVVMELKKTVKVDVVYLRKASAHLVNEKDEMMKRIGSHTISSKDGDYEHQANQLWDSWNVYLGD